MNTLEILKGARAKLASGWVAGERAKLQCGRGGWGHEPTAFAWCALGAIDAMVGHICEQCEEGRKAICAVADVLDPSWYGKGLASAAVGKGLPVVLYKAASIAAYNDGHTQKDVLDLFDRAIAKLQTGLYLPAIHHPLDPAYGRFYELAMGGAFYLVSASKEPASGPVITMTIA